MRRLGRLLCPALAALLLPAAAVGQTDAVAAASPVRRPPVSARDGVRINGVEYLEAAAFFRRYGLKAGWVEAGRRLRLESTWTTIELEADKREAAFNGLRFFLGEPVVARGRALHLSRIDAERLFGPILRPAGIAPAAPPVRTIVIDPGHGGRDTGTQNPRLGFQEKRYTLDVALRLQKLLELEGYRVVMTRVDDRFVELEERALLANREGADLFVSIHFNAVANAPAVHGTETYVMTPRHHASTQPERDREMIPAQYPGNTYDAWNAVLGHQLHRHLLGELKTMDRGLKRARFKVLTLLKCPAVLLESGYITNDAEARRIDTPAYRDTLAGAIATGIRAYAAQVDAARGS